MKQKDRSEFEKLIEEHFEWSAGQFPESTCESSLKGLEREIDEVRNAIDLPFTNSREVLEEYADCLMYIFDSAKRYGFTVDQIVFGFQKKLEKNKTREWSINPDKTYSHIKKSKK